MQHPMVYIHFLLNSVLFTFERAVSNTSSKDQEA